MEFTILGFMEAEIKTRSRTINKRSSAEKISELAELGGIQVGHGAVVHAIV
jgi:hypothetical protein